MIKDKISKAIKVYIDPDVSFRKQLEDLDAAGLFDMKMVREIITILVEHLDKPKKK